VRRTLALVATIAVAAGLAVVPSLGTGAGAAVNDDLEVQLESNVEPLTFSATVFDHEDEAVQAPLCDTASIITVGADGETVTPLSESTDGSDTVVFTLPSDTPPGQLRLEVGCGDTQFSAKVESTTLWGALAVTKVVTGSVPADAAFVVNVACTGLTMSTGGYDGHGAAGILEDYDVDLPLGAAGGTKYVHFDGPSDCTVTEPVNGGATATTIDPEETSNIEPTAYASTVTNTFPAEVSPSFTG
jgi:hypothetical protein